MHLGTALHPDPAHRAAATGQPGKSVFLDPVSQSDALLEQKKGEVVLGDLAKGTTAN